MAASKSPEPPSPTTAVTELGQTLPDLAARATAPIGQNAAGPALVTPAIAEPAAPVAQPPTANDLYDKPTRLGAQPPRIGRYILLRPIGQGGMGVVYAAYDEELDRKVAVKILHPSQQADEQLRSRVVREAQALARVSSPSVVHVYQVGETGGQIFIAMEFVNGTTLSKWQAEPGHSWQEILRMYSAAGQGLLDAHQAGLVHRDFKPDNVLLGSDGWPRVADFGLARLQSTSLSSVPELVTTAKLLNAAPGQPPLSNLTETGTALGTPLYMSPEQHMGEVVDSRSDQFSFCVALYEALYQQMPFAGDTLHSLRFNVVSGRVLPRPTDSHVPTIIHQAILRGLATDPAQRFPSMSELLAALSIDIATDASIGPGARREVVVSMVAVTLVAGLSITLPGWSGLGPEKSSLISAAVLCAFFSIMAVRFRRVIRRNWFHRGMLLYGWVVAVWMLGLRGVGFALDLGISQIMTIDLLAIAATSLMTVASIQPKLWPMIPIAAISAAISLRRPGYAQYLMPAVLQLGYVTSALLWYRAAVRPQPLRKPPPGPDALTRSGASRSAPPPS